MRILGVLFFLLNLFGSVVFWAGYSLTDLDSSIQISTDLNSSDFSIQQGSYLTLGNPLANNIVPETPSLRTTHQFSEVQTILSSFFGLSAICQSKGRNYQKLAKTIDSSLPAFLIVFPHHYFT